MPTLINFNLLIDLALPSRRETSVIQKYLTYWFLQSQVELGQVPTTAVQVIPEVSSSNNCNTAAWPKDLVISLLSSILCFPPLGILNFIKSRQMVWDSVAYIKAR